VLYCNILWAPKEITLWEKVGLDGIIGRPRHFKSFILKYMQLKMLYLNKNKFTCMNLIGVKNAPTSLLPRIA